MSELVTVHPGEDIVIDAVFSQTDTQLTISDIESVSFKLFKSASDSTATIEKTLDHGISLLSEETDGVHALIQLSSETLDTGLMYYFICVLTTNIQTNVVDDGFITVIQPGI
jgi:hypothetical protein